MTHPRHADVSHIPALPPSPGVSPWRDPRWLYGLDLFDAQFYWEAHEVWEDLWHTQSKASGDAQVVQGMIQLAASLLTAELGREDASCRLASRARAKLRRSAHARHPAYGEVQAALQTVSDQG